MTRQKITDVAIELIQKENTKWIGYDTFGLVPKKEEDGYSFTIEADLKRSKNV